MSIKILDFSTLSSISINNYSIVYNSNLSSIFKDIEDKEFVKELEFNITKNILLCFTKGVVLSFSNIFEIAIDMVNEKYKTTLDISLVLKEIDNYMSMFYNLYEKLENDICKTHYPIDEIDYKLVMMEIKDESFYREGKHTYTIW